MSAAGMRELLLRVQIDDEFAERLRADPQAAAAEFDVTAAEVELLKAPDWSLQRFLVPAHRRSDLEAIVDPHPPPIDPLTLPDLSTLQHPLGDPPPDEHPTPPPPGDLSMILPPTTLPEPMSNLHHPLVAPPDDPPNQERPPVLGPGVEQPPELGPAVDRGRVVDPEAVSALVADVRAASGDARRQKIVALLDVMQP